MPANKLIPAANLEKSLPLPPLSSSTKTIASCTQKHFKLHPESQTKSVYNSNFIGPFISRKNRTPIPKLPSPRTGLIYQFKSLLAHRKKKTDIEDANIPAISTKARSHKPKTLPKLGRNIGNKHSLKTIIGNDGIFLTDIQLGTVEDWVEKYELLDAEPKSEFERMHRDLVVLRLSLEL